MRRTFLQRNRNLVSIGGWCGPALVLGKLGMRSEAYPFDFSRVTLDGVTHFVRNGFGSGFYPPGQRPYRPECVGIWVLFRGQHTAFAHFDLNDDRVQRAFDRKIERWNELLAGEKGPVTFFRTIAAKNPADELSAIHDLDAAILERNRYLDYRIVVICHDQLAWPEVLKVPASIRLSPIAPHISLWLLNYTEDESQTLFDRSQRGYAEIVAHTLDEAQWPQQERKGPDEILLLRPESHLAEENLKREHSNGNAKEDAEIALCVPTHASEFPWRPHDNIALIDGIASVGGTCVGFGSTKCTSLENNDGDDNNTNNTTTPTMVQKKCAYCDSCDFHKAGRPFRTQRPFTSEEDELLLVHLYRIMTGADRVAAVEKLAHEMNRGAFEVILRIEFLTNSSTKIAEGLGMGDE